MLLRKLAGSGAVLVEGPKWCGKTTTCEQQGKSVLYMADPVRRDRYLTQAAVDITELMKASSLGLLTNGRMLQSSGMRFDMMSIIPQVLDITF